MSKKFDPNLYREIFGDIQLAYDDLSKKGKYNPNKGSYRKALGRGLGDETDWVKKLSDSTGRKGTDVSDYTANEFAQMHYDTYGKKEKRLGQDAYKTAFDKKNYNTEATVDTDTFQSLLNSLEGSKKRQQRQKSVEGRRDIYAQGLASMMRNF